MRCANFKTIAISAATLGNSLPSQQMKDRVQGENNRRTAGQTRWPIQNTIAWPKTERQSSSAF
jgi:hypothetical protein